MKDTQVERFGLSGRMYRRIGAVGEQSRPTYKGDTLWGNTFCQGLKVGLASYHFVSASEAYISYEHPLCAQWPPLDDGTPVPARVLFRNVVFDETEHVFRGTIEWERDHGVSWQGCIRWIYEMKFDSEYTCILSGKVETISQGGVEPREMSSFGFDLVYVNAAILDKFRSSHDNDAAEESEYDRYSRASHDLRTLLTRQGASVRTIAMMHHLLRVSQQPDSEQIIDFNL